MDPTLANAVSRATSGPRSGVCPYFVAALCVLALSFPGRAGAQESARDTLPIVDRVEIEGNESFSDKEIQRAIATKASGCKSVFLAPLCLVHLSPFENKARLNPRELRTDVARIRIFYYRRGYHYAQVDTSLIRSDDHVDVTFTVVEGEPIVVRSVDVRGLDGIEDADAIIRSLPLKPGRVFSELDLTRSRGLIERDLGNRGYTEAVVLVSSFQPSDDSLGAHVVLDTQAGQRYRIGEITVDGTVELTPDDVKRMLSFHTGDVYSLEEIVRSQRNLYAMALFDYVDVQAQPVASDTTVRVSVQVDEAKLRGVQFGGGVSSTECVTLQAGWANRNFLGGTRKLEINGVLSNIGTDHRAQQFPCNQAGVPYDEADADAFNSVNWLLRVDFRQPWFLGTANWLHLGLFTDRTSLPYVYANRSIGMDIRFSREISVGAALTASWRPSWSKLESGSASFLFCANFLICDPVDIAVLEEPKRLSPVTLTLALNRTDAVLNPSLGYRLTLEGETASRFTGSDWAYYRAQGEVAWYRQLVGRTVLALRFRAGLLRPIGSGIEGIDLTPGSEALTNPLKRQYAGGAYTVRGYNENLLGPKVLLTNEGNLDCPEPVVIIEGTVVCDPNTAVKDPNQLIPRAVGGQNSVVANAEVRFPLGSGRWRGVLFVDVGRVWTSGGGVPEAERYAWSPGVGIRYMSPVGPLRLDVGYDTSSGVRPLPVVAEFTEEVENQPRSKIVQLVNENGDTAPYRYDPFVDANPFQRMVLHFSIGHAF